MITLMYPATDIEAVIVHVRTLLRDVGADLLVFTHETIDAAARSVGAEVEQLTELDKRMKYRSPISGVYLNRTWVAYATNTGAAFRALMDAERGRKVILAQRDRVLLLSS